MHEFVNVLLVEDNEDHAELVKRQLADHKISNKIVHVSDGQAALDYLFQVGDYTDPIKYPRPHVILLDLRLPKVDGIDVLKAIKESEELRQIPVVVLTTSEAEKDIARAYGNHANSYIVKPIDFEKFKELMKDLGLYWMAWNTTPNPQE